MNKIKRELKEHLSDVYGLLEKHEVKALKKLVKKHMKEAFIAASPMTYSPEQIETDWKDWYDDEYKNPNKT